MNQHNSKHCLSLIYIGEFSDLLVSGIVHYSPRVNNALGE